MEDIDTILENYNPGKTDYKPDVTRQLAEIKIERENKIQEHMKKKAEYQDTINKITMLTNPQVAQDKINEQSLIIQELMLENSQLKEKVDYLNAKISKLIASEMERIKQTKQLSNSIDDGMERTT